MKPPPPAGFEEFGEIVQPLLGKSAPARHDVAPACDVELICHEPARKERRKTRTQRRRRITQTRPIYFCGKLRRSPPVNITGRPQSLDSRNSAGFGSLSPVKPHIRLAELLRFAAATSRVDCRFQWANTRTSPGKRRPVRGDSRTGQAIWALGWMGARAEYGLDGEESSLPQLLGRARAVARSTARDFFLPLSVDWKWLRNGPAGLPSTAFPGYRGLVASTSMVAGLSWISRAFSTAAASDAAITGTATTAA